MVYVVAALIVFLVVGVAGLGVATPASPRDKPERETLYRGHLPYDPRQPSTTRSTQPPDYSGTVFMLTVVIALVVVGLVALFFTAGMGLPDTK